MGIFLRAIMEKNRLRKKNSQSENKYGISLIFTYECGILRDSLVLTIIMVIFKIWSYPNSDSKLDEKLRFSENIQSDYRKESYMIGHYGCHCKWTGSRWQIIQLYYNSRTWA
jgi:hypothetical protein